MDIGAQLLLERVVPLLRLMDAAQQATDKAGLHDIAWYHFREKIEDALGLPSGTLDTQTETPKE